VHRDGVKQIAALGGSDQETWEKEKMHEKKIIKAKVRE